VHWLVRASCTPRPGANGCGARSDDRSAGASQFPSAGRPVPREMMAESAWPGKTGGPLLARIVHGTARAPQLAYKKRMGRSKALQPACEAKVVIHELV